MMTIESIPVDRLQLAEYNPRVDLKPDDPEYRAIERSLDTYGLVQPLVWNKQTGNLVAGHQRLKVLTARGATAVDCSVVDVDPTRERALNLALNKIQGRWDNPKLLDVLTELDTSGLDLRVTGFDTLFMEDLAKTLTKPLFEPNTAPVVPQVLDSQVTDADVRKAEEHQATRFTAQKPTRAVTCPQCNHSFDIR